MGALSEFRLCLLDKKYDRATLHTEPQKKFASI